MVGRGAYIAPGSSGGTPRAVGPFLPGGLATMGPSPLSGRLRGSDAHVEEQAGDEGDDMERQLESESHIAAPPDVVREALTTEPGRILAARPVPAQARSFPVEMRVDSEGGTAAAQQVVLDLGLPGAEAGEFPVSWVPAAHTRLLPSFQGSLTVSADGDESTVRISGSYRPPLGRFGAFGDGVIGHRVARRSLDELVAMLSTKLGDEARRWRDALAPLPAPYPESLRDRPPAEIFLG